jgi:hypothetical protein
MPAWLRWLALVPAAAVGWYGSLIAGIGARSVLMSFCPSDEIISGLCSASWYAPAEDALMCVFAGIAAALIVTLPTLVAPSRKVTVAFIVLLLGSLVAVVMGSQIRAFGPMICAVLAGTLAAMLLRRHYLALPNPSVGRP